MGDARQIEMLRAKVMASMPLRKSQQQTTLVALEEREEGELSAEDDEPMGIYAAAVPRKSVPNLEARASRKEKPVISAASKAEVAQPMTQVSIVNKSQLLNVFSAPAPPLASLQGPMQVRNPEIASGPKLKVEFLPTDAGLAKHQGAHVQIQGNSFRGQLNLSVNKITEAAPAALGQSELPVLDHPVTHDRKRGRSREAIMVPVTQTKAVAPWVASPLVGAIASSSGLHSSQVAPASVSGVRSEVDSFLASLHLPVVPASSTPFAEEKFVIKFDSDSDSEGEQQGNRSTHGQFSGHQSIGLLSQSPADMRSEIDRMKKQIAVMERNKGKANSNSHLTSQSTSLSKVTGSRTGMADLQSLRQQIAAKENELLERRQRLAVPSAMTTPRLPVGKVLEHQNADIAKVGDGQTRLGMAVQMTHVEKTGQNTFGQEMDLGSRPSLSGSTILTEARDVESNVGLTLPKSGVTLPLKRSASDVDLSGEQHKLRKVELPSERQPQQLVTRAQSSLAQQHGMLTTNNKTRKVGVDSVSSAWSDGHAILKHKLEDGHFPVHTQTAIPITKKSQKLSMRADLSQQVFKFSTAPAEGTRLPLVSQGPPDSSVVIRSPEHTVRASVEQGSRTASVVRHPDSSVVIRSPEHTVQASVEQGSRTASVVRHPDSSVVIRSPEHTVQASVEQGSRTASVVRHPDSSVVIRSPEHTVQASVEQGSRTASVVRHPDSGLSNKDGVLLKNAQSMCSNSSGLQVVGDTMSGVLPVPQESECEHALGLNDENPSSTSHQTNVLVSDASAQPAISSIGTLVELPVGNSVETLIHVEQSKQAHSTPSSVVLNKPTSSSPIRRIVPSFSVKSSIFSPITTVTQSSYDTATSINPPGYALWPPLPQLQAGTSQLEPSGMHGPIWSIDPGGENRMQLLRQMQEEEEAVDKALEEAQLRRRQCEVSERDARRLYQDAQSALASANALCDALLHQRKLLNAQLRAAELHMLQPPPFAMPTDRRLSYDRHPQLTEPVKFPSAAWTNQQQLPGGMAFGSRVHVRGNQRQVTLMEDEGQATTTSPLENFQTMGSQMSMAAGVLKANLESPFSKRSSDHTPAGRLLELQMGADTVGNQKVHRNLDVYPVQNVEHSDNAQSHEIPDLSLDCWRGSAAVNASDDASPVHTVVKDSKAIQVRRLSAADLEGSCGDAGTNGLEGCFRPEKSDLQHLTQNGGNISTRIEKLPDDRSQKPVMLSTGMEKIDPDEIGAAPNSKVETVQGLGFDNQPTYEEQLQPSDREQKSAVSDLDKHIFASLSVHSAGKECPMNKEKLSTSEIMRTSLGEESQTIMERHAAERTIAPLQKDTISLAPGHHFAKTDGIGLRMILQHGSTGIPAGDEAMMMASSPSVRLTAVCDTDEDQIDARHSRVEVCFPVECPESVVDGHNVDDCEQTTMVRRAGSDGECTMYVEDDQHTNEKAQEEPVSLIFEDATMPGTQDSQSDSEGDGHDDDLSTEVMPILVKSRPEITGLRALADDDVKNDLLPEKDAHVQGDSFVEFTNAGHLVSSDSLVLVKEAAAVQQDVCETAPGTPKASQVKSDKEKMHGFNQKFSPGKVEGHGFEREQESGRGDKGMQVQKGSVMEAVTESRAGFRGPINSMVANGEPFLEGVEVRIIKNEAFFIGDEQLPSSVLYGISYLCLEKPSEEHFEWMGTSLTTSMSLGKYESPLSMFRSYRLSPQFGLAWHYSVESKTWSHGIDIWKPLCKFEHRGKCNNDACLGQHVADYTLGHTGLLSQLQRYEYLDNQLGDNDMSARTVEAAISDIVDKGRTFALPAKSKVAPIMKSFLKDQLWNRELSVPIYQIGPNILRPDQMDLCSRVRCLLRFQPKVVSFSSSLLSPALCRSLLPDVPCLLTATVEDSSITHAAEESRRYIGDAGYSQEVAEEHVLKYPADIEAWLELALTVIDYDLSCQDMDAHKEALYILSRALEANPTVVVLWVVYIGLFYNKESNIGTDDMFHHAVGFNPNSYELWLLFIHSRPKLGDCLDAYKLALQSLCSLEENDQEEQSACLLDLALQMLNCMCVSSQTSLLHGWVDALADPKVSNRGLLALLTPNDSCVLWVGCAYAVAFGELPHEFVRRLGCNQLLPFELNWDRRSEVQEGSGARVIKLLNAGMNCLVGTAHQRSQHALAVNHVQCLALYHGLNQALMMAHRQWEMHPSCVELVLLVARMEGKTGGVAIFEKALQHWPHHQVGLQQLWNQYAVHVLQWGGKSSALRVLYQCASRATAVNVSASWELRQDSKVRDALEFIAENNMSNGSFGSIGCDAVFAWLNLALFEVLSGDRGHAQAAVERSMKASISSEDVRHCWREMAALTVLGDVDNVRQPNHVLDLLDRCCVETDVLWKLTPLSSKVSKNISKHRLRSFIEFLLGPSPVDYSVVNSFVHTFIAKGLRLGKLTSGLVEGVLAVMPGNVEVVLPLCRLLRHEPTSIQELAAVIWASSIILSTLLQACPQAPERDWVEAGQLLAHLGDKSSLQEFYQHALVVYPFSAALQCSLSELQQSHVDRTVAVEDTLLEGVPIC